MELSSEDNLRLHVLLAQSLQALRIDESKMLVHALSDKGEANVPLNPNCRHEKYLRLVRQTISSHVLGSPGGYPVYLKRWTRMGQARDDSLQRLLLLGEPEAVIAVVHAPGLTDDLARRAWWASSTSENARRMLERESVVKGKMGSELAEFLVEFLPFEEEPKDIIDSVRLLLQPGLVSDAVKAELWKKGKRKNTYYAGFLEAIPDELPAQSGPHPDFGETHEILESLSSQANPIAGQLLRIMRPAGQAFLQTVEEVLVKPNNQDVVVTLLDTLDKYFSPVRPDNIAWHDITTILKHAEHLCSEEAGESSFAYAAQQVLSILPELHKNIVTMLALSMISHTIVDPIFSITNAIGSVMRKRLQPVTNPILNWLACLQGKSVGISSNDQKMKVE